MGKRSDHKKTALDDVRATDSIATDAIAVYRNDIHREERVALILLHRDGFVVEHLAEARAVVVGRDEPATVRLPDATLSREHARFCLKKSHVEVVDLGSTNGTWLGGNRIQKELVAIGDELMLGGVVARLRVLGPSYSEFDPSDVDSNMVVGPVMKSLLATARRVADARIPVILQGETGSGKEILARFIHQNGPRKDNTMISVNCAAIPAQLVESTLFGHERGAFTGAIQTRKGVFEVADQGTIFLDEIGELPLETQAVLLRVLETGTFSRVGASAEIKTDVRIITATHRDLQRMVKDGAFRADLFYRLNTMILPIPPLRSRKDEIEPLVMRFLQRANQANRRSVASISQAALGALKAYDWPGNVRELFNAIERAVVIATDDRVEVSDLPHAVLATSAEPGGARQPDYHPPSSAERGADESAREEDFRTRLQNYEARLLREALEACQWNRTEAARRLGMSLRTLRYKVKALGIVRSEAD